MAIAKSSTRRDWRDAIRKVHAEGRCRVCGSPDALEAAHTISRRLQDYEVEGPKGGVSIYVKPESIIPLCKTHHMAYDARRLDLLPYTFLPEQVWAVETAGGIAAANKRLSGPNG